MTSAPLIYKILFWVASLVGIPLGAFLCRLYRPLLYVVFGVLVFSTLEQNWSITFFSREAYKAATRGLEIHLADLLALMLFFAMLLRHKEYPIYWLPPMMGIYCLFLVLAFFSWLFADHGVYPNFEVHQELVAIPYFEPGVYPLFEMSKIVRGMFLFLVVVSFCKDKRSIKALLITLSLLVIVITFWGLYSRYVMGNHRISVGSFHTNDLGGYIGMIGLFLFSFAFSLPSRKQAFFLWFLTICSFVTIILTVSRASLAGFFVGALFVTCFSLPRFPRVRNFLMIALGVVATFLILLKAEDALITRFTKEETTSEAIDIRLNLNREAVLMANEHPLWVGLGNFSFWAIRKYADRAFAEKYNIPHNVYFLTLAELGYAGLVLFMLFWARLYWIFGEGIWRTIKDRNPYAYSIFVGACAASLMLQFQNAFHFSFRQTSIFFLLHLFMGVAVRTYLALPYTFSLFRIHWAKDHEILLKKGH